MATNTYDIGSAVVVKATFTADGVLINPTTVTLRITDPNGVVSVYQIVDMIHPSAGVYTYQLLGSIAGVWRYRFEATGAVSGVMDGDFVVAGPTAGWSYSADQLSTSPLYCVRLLIGDVVACDPQMLDAEVQFFVQTYGSLYGAAAACCRSLQAKFSRSVDQQAGTMKASYSQLARAYGLKALEYESKAATANGAMPYAGGISVRDRFARALNEDRTPPQFTIGFTDNYLPLPSVGQESQENMQ